MCFGENYGFVQRSTGKKNIFRVAVRVVAGEKIAMCTEGCNTSSGFKLTAEISSPNTANRTSNYSH